MSDTDMVNRSGKQSEAIENWELVTGFGYMMVLFSPDADKGNFTEVDFISSQRDHTKAKVSPVEFDVILYSLSVSETRTHSGGIASRAIHTVSLRKKKTPTDPCNFVTLRPCNPVTFHSSFHLLSN